MMTSRVHDAMLRSLPPVSTGCRRRALARLSEGRLAALLAASLLALGTAWGTHALVAPAVPPASMVAARIDGDR